jgi:hypothetical protein
MSDRALRLPALFASRIVRPPGMAEVQKTQERLFCLIFPGLPGPVMH